MRFHTGLLPFLLLTFIFGCGDSEDSLAPGAPELKLRTNNEELRWNDIAGADTYALYINVITDCPDISASEETNASKDDTKVEDVSSPFSIEDYKDCDTCYWAAIAASNDVGEGPLSRSVGWQYEEGCTP